MHAQCCTQHAAHTSPVKRYQHTTLPCLFNCLTPPSPARSTSDRLDKVTMVVAFLAALANGEQATILPQAASFPHCPAVTPPHPLPSSSARASLPMMSLSQSPSSPLPSQVHRSTHYATFSLPPPPPSGELLPLFSLLFGEFTNAFGDPNPATFMATIKSLALKFLYLGIGEEERGGEGGGGG